jgi:hypothetical protein
LPYSNGIERKTKKNYNIWFMCLYDFELKSNLLGKIYSFSIFLQFLYFWDSKWPQNNKEINKLSRFLCDKWEFNVFSGRDEGRKDLGTSINHFWNRRHFECNRQNLNCLKIICAKIKSRRFEFWGEIKASFQKRTFQAQILVDHPKYYRKVIRKLFHYNRIGKTFIVCYQWNNLQ